jgi:hypothetical protein
VPNVTKRLPKSAYLVLGKTLMWLITSFVAAIYAPVKVKKDQGFRIRLAFVVAIWRWTMWTEMMYTEVLYPTCSGGMGQ